MAQPFKHPRSGIYYLRRKVPPLLQAALGREFKRSLKTTDAAEAKSRFAEAWSESDRVFALARKQTSGHHVLTLADAQQIASRWLRREQERLERTGAFVDALDVYTENALDEPVEAVRTYADFADDAENGEWEEFLQSLLERAARSENVPVPTRGSLGHSRLFAAMDEQARRLSAWAMERLAGKRPSMGEGAMPQAPLSFEGRGGGPASTSRSLRALFTSYSEAKLLNDGDTRATRRTVAAYGTVIEGFGELYGEIRADAVSRALVAEYRAALAKLPAKGEGTRGLTAPELIEKAEAECLPRIQAPTIRNRLRALSAVLSHGVAIGWLAENPVTASGIGRQAAKAATRRQAETRRRKDYTQAELLAIFTSPAFVDPNWSSPRADFGRAWYWMPLLLYYTGARREELAQLVPADVRASADAPAHLSILAAEDVDDAGRTVKTAGSRRLVPLHPDLLERGFLNYVKAVSHTGRLFPQLKPDPKGYFGSNFGKRWAAYLRDAVGLTSTANPIHGFRHTFKTLCREVGIPEDVHDALTGHAGDGGRVARGYGSMPLERMAAELAKLPRVPPAPK